MDRGLSEGSVGDALGLPLAATLCYLGSARSGSFSLGEPCAVLNQETFISRTLEHLCFASIESGFLVLKRNGLVE